MQAVIYFDLQLKILRRKSEEKYSKAFQHVRLFTLKAGKADSCRDKSTHQPALPENAEEILTNDKKVIEKVEHKSCPTDPDKNSKDNSESKDISKRWSHQRLPLYLQPWDARKR